MGKVIQFPFGDEGENKEKKEEFKEEELKTEPLSEEDFQELVEPLKEGLKTLYPSQVKEVHGFIGLGEKRGKEKFVAGLLFWEHYKYQHPLVSSFLAVFNGDKLEKISFLEAKNNYWDWKLLVKTYKDRFHTEELLNGLIQLKDKFQKGEL
ncbi:hypothetical protein [Aquifex sp.]